MQHLEVAFEVVRIAYVQLVPPLGARPTSSSISWSSTGLADADATDSAVSGSFTLSLFIDASSMIGSYTERFAVPANRLTVPGYTS